MKYYITTLELAQSISATKAQQMGCTGVTTFWWGIIKHPDTSEVAICIPPEEYAPVATFKVLYESQNLLITTNDLSNFEELDGEGWFPSTELEV